ncbi:unnamed protein product [Haemonchus placei]|uniref:Uncharacterized protein n=1 Tax=Haemonchus placei TaxID=6290 RepID=A0A3P7Z5R7_HAEPC|nr:unnamed protein product [Haemonchus placei]
MRRSLQWRPVVQKLTFPSHRGQQVELLSKEL